MLGRPEVGERMANELRIPPCIHLTQERNSDDIARYVRKELVKSKNLRRAVKNTPALEEEIVTKLSAGAQGMFL